MYGADSRVTSTTAVEGATVLEAMVKYMAQSGVYVVGQAPFIELHYGAGEVAQAFVRNCCVHGGQIALGVQVSSVLVQHGAVAGIRLADGHTVSCSALVGSFGYVSQLHNCVVEDTAVSEKSAEDVGDQQRSVGGAMGGKGVSRGIVGLTRSVLDHLTNCKIVIPPGECGNAHTVTVWQCHDTLHSCPKGSVLLYLSVNVTDDPSATDTLEQCVVALLSARTKLEASKSSINEASGGSEPENSVEESTMHSNEAQGQHATPATIQEWPEVTFSCFFMQPLPDAAQLKLPASIVCCGDAGTSTEMDSGFLEAEEIFARLFPDVVFLTKAPAVGVEANKEDEEQGDDLDNALKALGLV